MALGGGTWTAQNKVLPGTYVNFVSVASASASLSDRGIVTMPLALDWGVEGEVFEVTNEDFQKNTLKIFGYEYTADEIKGLRDLFLNAQTLYAYRLNGGGVKATNTYATAKFGGTRGNALKIKIAANVDDATLWDVTTLMDTTVVDVQTVSSASELVANDFVTFKSFTITEAVAGASLSGGTNATVTAASHQAYLDAIESYSYNTMGVVTTESTLKSLYVSFNKRLRDEIGKKFQLVVYNYPTADYMGVISVDNKVLDGATTSEGTTTYPNEAAAVYWVTGAEGGCAVNASCQNKAYNGEFDIDVNYTQNQLKAGILAGKFLFHSVNGDVRVLDDINTMVTTTDTQGDVFKDNQTIRVIDQLANDAAVIFATKYLGVVPNDKAGRNSLWLDLVKIRQELMRLRAIEDFNDADITVEQGDTKKAVLVTGTITVVNAMSKLYMTTTIA